MPVTRPMKATQLTSLEDVKFPCIVQPKLDGVRCCVLDTVPLTASWKFIPNDHIRNTLMKFFQKNISWHLIDGELIVGNNIQETVSAVMSKRGEPDFKYHVFDGVRYWDETRLSYDHRSKRLGEWLAVCNKIDWLLEVPSYDCISRYDLEVLKTELEEYEGLIIRSPAAPYKSGRSTLKEHYLLKWKPFQDSEARIVGFIEQLHNNNPAEQNELGYVERSSCATQMDPAGTLGALLVEDVVSKVQFKIGTGFTARQRREIWNHKKDYLGKILTYKHQPFGEKNKPRIPVFKCWRDERDMTK